MSDATHGRRRFLALLPATLGALLVSGRGLPASAQGASCGTGDRGGRPDDTGSGRGPAPRAGVHTGHPEPRPGIDASRVLPPAEVPAHASGAFDAVREIPQVMDGIRCHCGCAEIPDMYSLLSCFEDEGMARFCEVCQGQARLVAELHGQGRTLEEIRAAVDERYA